MTTILRQDKRDKHGHVFGQVTDIPDEFILPITDSPIEAPEEVDCTAISTCIVAESQTGKKYDIKELWNRVKNKTQFGADPRDTLGEAVKNGIKTIDGTLDKRWTGYVRCDSGAFNASQNIQSMILTTNSAIMVNTNFYNNWLQPVNTVLPIGENVISGHSWAVISGWKKVNGVSVFIVNFWQGYTLLMPFNVLDDALSKWGCTAFILTTKDIGDKIRLSLMEKIRDFCVNVILALQRLIILKKTMPTATPLVDNELTMTKPQVDNQIFTPHPKIYTWAKAIVKWEGHFDGNLKFTTLTKSWGATQGRPAQDGGHFCVWKDENAGFQALCNFLTLACEGELIIAHHPCTYYDFTVRFAGNPPTGYINGIMKEIDCNPTTDISTFLL